MQKRNVLIMIVLILSTILVSSSVLAYSDKPWENFDFGGQVVKITTRWDTLTPLAPRHVIKWSDEDPRVMAHIAEVERMFNCKIEFTFALGWNRLREDALAGDKTMDIFHVHSALALDLAKDGFLYSLDDVLDATYYESLPPELRAAKSSFTFGGSVYGFAGEHRFAAGEPHGIIWNQNLFEEQGLPDPYQLWQNGEWTWDAFLEIARLATKDTTGDGEIDQYGFVSPHNYGWNPIWSATNDHEWIQNDEINLSDSRLIETLEFLQQLNSEGLIGDASTVPFEKQVMYGSQFVHILQNQPERLNSRHSMVPLPKGPSAKDNKSLLGGAVWGAVIPVTASHDPRAIIEVVNALWQITEPYIKHMNVFVDLDHWREFYWAERALSVPDFRTLEVWQWILTNAVAPYDVPIQVISGQFYEGIAHEILRDGGSPAAVLDSWGPVAREAFKPYRVAFYDN